MAALRVARTAQPALIIKGSLRQEPRKCIAHGLPRTGQEMYNAYSLAASRYSSRDVGTYGRPESLSSAARISGHTIYIGRGSGVVQERISNPGGFSGSVLFSYSAITRANHFDTDVGTFENGMLVSANGTKCFVGMQVASKMQFMPDTTGYAMLGCALAVGLGVYTSIKLFRHHFAKRREAARGLLVAARRQDSPEAYANPERA